MGNTTSNPRHLEMPTAFSTPRKIAGQALIARHGRCGALGHRIGQCPGANLQPGNPNAREHFRKRLRGDGAACATLITALGTIFAFALPMSAELAPRRETLSARLGTRATWAHLYRVAGVSTRLERLETGAGIAGNRGFSKRGRHLSADLAKARPEPPCGPLS